jgi:hypothetical protein
VSRQLTSGVASEFLSNLKAINNPTSFSYNDNYCGAWLDSKVKDYGFASWEKMAAACRKLLKVPAPVKMVKIPARLLGELRNFIESMQIVVNKDMSFSGISVRSKELVKKIDATRRKK